MIAMEPKDVIKLDIIKLGKSERYPQENVLPGDGLYIYLYQPSEQHGDQKRQVTDFIWRENTYRLVRIVEGPGNHVLYYL